MFIKILEMIGYIVVVFGYYNLTTNDSYNFAIYSMLGFAIIILSKLIELLTKNYRISRKEKN